MKLIFPETDVGLGTAYERVAIYRLFDQWLQARPVETALEGPIDGMAGIAGVHLVGRAKAGTRVTVELTDARALDTVRGVYAHLGVESRLTTKLASLDAIPSEPHDLVLTYNALPLLDDWRPYLEQMAARARRYLLVSVTSPFSYGVMIRKALRVFEGGPHHELFDHPSTRPEQIEPMLRRFGRIVEHAFLDSPWWPDLFVDTGQSLLSGTLARLPLPRRLIPKPKGPDRGAGYLYGPTDFPLFQDHPGWPAFARALRKHPVFDTRGEQLARLFGHHHAYLIERPGA
jgi:hypothetical protein